MPDPANLSTPLAYALAYAAIGWHVLPIEAASKAPMGRLVPRGMLDASVDPETIRKWWKFAPTAGVGISLAPSGLVAVDVDPRNGGNETFDALQVEHGSLRSEVMAFTGGGGEHHVFVVPHGTHISLPGTLGRGIDLKANGYIVVEPSIHPSGKQYSWEASSSPLDGVAPSPLPDWLRGLRIDLKPRSPMPGDVPVDARQAREVREALYLLDADVYDDWLRAGMALHSTGWGEPAYAMWCAWAQQSPKFDATVSRKKWESFRSDGGGVSVSWVFAQAQAKGWVNPRARIAEDPREEPPPEFEDARQSTDLPLVFAEDITDADAVIEQIVEDVITTGALSVMYGESNSGKSFLCCDMDCNIGAGTDWLGKRVVRGPVLYVAGEGAQSIKLRILAWRRKHGVDPWVAVVPVACNLLDPDADVMRIIRAAQAVGSHYGQQVVKITFDTLARAFGGGNENASEDMGAVILNADRIREATGAHVMLVHHAGKDSAKGSRGHSSLKAATDTEIEVTGEEDTKLHTAHVTKQRDLGSRGEKLTGKFSVIPMGIGQWDKPITTCVVDFTDEEPAQPAKKARGAELRMAIVSVLSVASNRTMKRKTLIDALIDAGFTSSPIYRALGEMAREAVTSESMGAVHLNNMPSG